jgi:hypothetical protein
MRKIYIIFLFQIFSIGICFSQADKSSHDTATFNSIPKNSIYFEILGNGFFESLNYERVLISEDRHFITLRTGCGYMLLDPYGATIPLMINNLIHLSNRRIFEIGFGTTIQYNYLFGRTQYYDHETPSAFSFTALIGYRFQAYSGFLFRIGFTPFIQEGTFGPIFGVSLGYSFARKYKHLIEHER